MEQIPCMQFKIFPGNHAKPKIKPFISTYYATIYATIKFTRKHSEITQSTGEIFFTLPMQVWIMQ